MAPVSGIAFRPAVKSEQERLGPRGTCARLHSEEQVDALRGRIRELEAKLS